ncbi:MAG TPA: helix-turn-helix domain-containing protein [Solirubrobacterales bacterium]|nr:helix-turn-helix domain-containing protein [Solirubrobacterales bacterium]
MAGDTGNRALKAISHPTRIEVLRVLQNRVASPKELASELGENLSNVSYHFKYLRQEGCIEIVETVPRRGALEHHYRATATGSTAVTVRNLVAEAVRALNAGTFGAGEDGCLDWRSVELDEQGRRELSERQAEWLEEVERIATEASKRLAKGKSGQGKRIVAGAIGFETPPGPGFVSAGAEG